MNPTNAIAELIAIRDTRLTNAAIAHAENRPGDRDTDLDYANSLSEAIRHLQGTVEPELPFAETKPNAPVETLHDIYRRFRKEVSATPAPKQPDGKRWVEVQEVTHKARHIFGEQQVVAAFYPADQVEKLEKYAQINADDLGIQTEELEEWNVMSLPTHGEVLVQFSNGRKVTFGTSEWASIELVGVVEPELPFAEVQEQDFYAEARTQLESVFTGSTRPAIEDAARLVANWMSTAAQNQRNTDYYRDLLDQCAQHLGPDVFKCDDGVSISDKPLRAKIPELVARLSDQAVAVTPKPDISLNGWVSPLTRTFYADAIVESAGINKANYQKATAHIYLDNPTVDPTVTP